MLRFILTLVGSDQAFTGDWILNDGTWDDTGFWRDNATWQDS
jgi:hypothetical protein